MSSPEYRRDETPDSGGDERSLVVMLIVPGDLETRSFTISYRRLRYMIAGAAALLLVFAFALSVLFPVVIQAANAGEMRRQLEELEQERARIREMGQTLQQMEQQYERVRQMLGADAAITGDSSFILPPLRVDTADARPRSGASGEEGDNLAAVDLWPLYVPGYVTRALADGRSQHPGLDIAVPRNSYVRAAGAGTVRIAGVDSIYGQYVILDHGAGLHTVYGHASRLFVTAGDAVERGEVIALSGSSGRSTAPHLHFEVRKNGQAVDPLSLVRQP